jgi:tetratricopeptide (TPR) repeat protein
MKLFSWLITGSLIFAIHVNIVHGGTHDTVLISQYLRKALAIKPQHFDSALMLTNKAYPIALNSENDTMVVKVLKSIGTIYHMSNNYKLAIEYYFKSLKKIDASEEKFSFGSLVNTRLYLMSSIGGCYFYMNMMPQSTEYMNKSAQYIVTINKKNPGVIPDVSKLKLFYNAGSLLLEAGKSDSALSYMKQVLALNEKNNDSIVLGAVMSNIGIIFLKRGLIDSAYPFLLRSLSIRRKIGDSAGVAGAYNNLAKYYLFKKDFSASAKFYKMALITSIQCNSPRSHWMALRGLIAICGDLKLYQEAFFHQKELDSLNNTSFNPDVAAKAVDFARQYEYDKQFKTIELEHNKNIQSQHRMLILFAMVAGFFLLILIIVFLLLVIQRNKTQQEKLKQSQLMLEGQNLELEKKNLQLELEFRNKELVTKAIYLVQKNELIREVAERFGEIKTEIPEQAGLKISHIIHDLKQSADSTGWKEFELRFMEVNREFYNNLIMRYPHLTPNERKLACFLRLNMTTKEISSITFQTGDSIKVARTRLRKKMGLSQDDSLIAFLECI